MRIGGAGIKPGPVKEMKISLAINSKNPIKEYLDELFKTANGFDDVVFYCDEDIYQAQPWQYSQVTMFLADQERRDIKDGFNYAISFCSGDWICSFCDDDFFVRENLAHLLKAMREEKFADDADIIHFPIYTGSGSWGDTKDFSENDLRDANLLPHGSFFRKEVWEKLGGYKINAGADWNFWIRAKAAGYRFKFWPSPIYFFRTEHPRSAWGKQINEFGLNEIKRLVNATA